MSGPTPRTWRTNKYFLPPVSAAVGLFLFPRAVRLGLPAFSRKFTCARLSPGYDTIIAIIRIAALQTGRACVGPCRSDGPEPSGREVRRPEGDRQEIGRASCRERVWRFGDDVSEWKRRPKETVDTV